MNRGIPIKAQELSIDIMQNSGINSGASNPFFCIKI